MADRTARRRGIPQQRGGIRREMRKGDMDREVRRLEVEIDRFQEQLDSFNYRTNISLDTALLGEIEATPPPPGT